MNSGGRDRTGCRPLASRFRLVILAASLLVVIATPAMNRSAPAAAQARYSTEACQFNGAGQYTSLEVGVAGTATVDPLNQTPNTVTLSAVFVAAPIVANFGLIGYNFGFLSVGTNQVPMTASLTVTATNTVEGTQTFNNVSVSATTVITDPDGIRLTGDETATPLPITFALPTSTWTVTGGGDVAFSNSGSTTTATLGTFTSVIDCQSGVPSNCGPTGTNCPSFTPTPAVPFAIVPGDGLRLQHQAPTVMLTPLTLGGGPAVAFGSLPPLTIDCAVVDADCIPADNLGWMPAVPVEYRSTIPGASGVVAGPASAPSAADWLARLEAAGPGGLNGLGGLGEINVLCVTPPGSPSSTVGCGAELFLGIPASAAAGSYAGVLVLTII